MHLRVLHSGWTRSLHERTLQTFDKTLAVLVTRGGLVDPVDCTESGCNELHSIPSNILDLEERCNLKMCILASQRHAQNTEG